MHARQPRIGRSLDVSQYDFLLALLPVPLFLGVVYGTLAPVPPSLGAGLGGAVSSMFLGYCLFVAAPVDRERASTTDSSRAVR